MNASKRASDPAGVGPASAVRDAIHDLKSRYFFHADNRQWTALRTLFTDDAAFEGFAFQGIGPDRFVEAVSKFLEGVTSVHHGCMPQLRALSDTTVRGRWSMVDYLTWAPGSRSYRGNAEPDLSGFRGYGYYDEEYRLTPAGWRISFIRLTRLRVDLLHGSAPADTFGAPGPVPDWLA